MVPEHLRQLHHSTEALYEVFSAYPRPHVIETSPYRNAVQINADLNSSPLRNLSEDKIGPYASCAMTTAGDIPEYKYYLPRILELAVFNECSHSGTTPDGISHKLRYGQFWSWPQLQQDAVLDFFQNAFAFTCIESSAKSSPTAWLQALAELDDVGPAVRNVKPLTRVSIVNRASAVAALIVHFDRDTRNECPAYSSKTRQWLFDGNAADEVLLEGARFADEVDQYDITNAFDMLQSLKTNNHS